MVARATYTNTHSPIKDLNGTSYSSLYGMGMTPETCAGIATNVRSAHATTGSNTPPSWAIHPRTLAVLPTRATAITPPYDPHAFRCYASLNALHFYTQRDLKVRKMRTLPKWRRILHQFFPKVKGKITRVCDEEQRYTTTETQGMTS